ncbi:hypothetical protein D1007_48065 [Hordeum vulgare]|nr:hypothetical protein D1007_48065 [Hordeum vulgare]
MPMVPRSVRAHVKEVSRRRQQLTPENRINLVYVADSSYWEVWFAFEHKEQRRRGVRDLQARTPPPLIVRDVDQEALVSALHESEEEERRKQEQEQAAY